MIYSQYCLFTASPRLIEQHPYGLWIVEKSLRCLAIHGPTTRSQNAQHRTIALFLLTARNCPHFLGWSTRRKLGRPKSIDWLVNAAATLVLSFSNARLYIAISRESDCGIFGCPFWVAAGSCEAWVVTDCASAPRDEVACASASRDVVFLVRRLGVVLVSFAAAGG